MKPITIQPAHLLDATGAAFPDDKRLTLTVGQLRTALDEYAARAVAAALVANVGALTEWLAAVAAAEEGEG